MPEARLPGRGQSRRPGSNCYLVYPPGSKQLPVYALESALKGATQEGTLQEGIRYECVSDH
jgi:hypothetical protein